MIYDTITSLKEDLSTAQSNITIACELFNEAFDAIKMTEYEDAGLVREKILETISNNVIFEDV